MTAQLASEGPLTPQDYRTQTSSRNLHPLGRMRELLEWAAATDLPRLRTEHWRPWQSIWTMLVRHFRHRLRWRG